MHQFILPDLGEGLEEAEIVAWHVNEGDHVVADQPLVSVETDKAVVEVPSPRRDRAPRAGGRAGARAASPRSSSPTTVPVSASAPSAKSTSGAPTLTRSPLPPCSRAMRPACGEGTSTTALS